MTKKKQCEKKTPVKFEIQLSKNNRGALFIKQKTMKIEDTELPDLLKILIDSIQQREVKKEMPLDFFLNRIAEKTKLEYSELDRFLCSMDTLYMGSIFSLLLKEIALYLDEQYSDHISNSEKIYSVSSLNGKICPVNKAHIKNYKNFAAFRSIEDAKIACRILKPIIKAMFKDGK